MLARPGAPAAVGRGLHGTSHPGGASEGPATRSSAAWRPPAKTRTSFHHARPEKP